MGLYSEIISDIYYIGTGNKDNFISQELTLWRGFTFLKRCWPLFVHVTVDCRGPTVLCW